MLRQVVAGATAVLTVGMLAVGCGSDGDTIIIGGNGLLNNNDSFPASSIFSNNVWADGGAFSPNDADIQEWRVVWSCDDCSSDGEFQGDNSAIVLFQVRNNSGNNEVRQFVSHYNGSNFTTPEQLIGVDQDEQAAPGSLNAIVAVQLNTSGYTAANQTDTSRIQQNDNTWVVVFSATTFTNNPNNGTTQVQSNTVGPHRTLYYTAFRNSSRDTNETTISDFIGTANPVTLRHGWALPAVEIVPTSARAGIANDTVSGGTPANPTVACDVQSYGLISDGYQGQTNFGGTGNPLNAGASRAVPQSGSYRSASFSAGERTNFVHLFYVQMLNSMASGGPSLAIGQSGGANAQSNGRFAAFAASLNLSTLQWETPTEFRPAAARNSNSDALRSPGTGFYPTFHGYNQHLFYKYADASLIVGTNADPLSITGGGAAFAYDNVGGNEGANMPASNFYEDICGVATIVDDGDGTSSIAASSILDLAGHTSTAGVHDLTNPTSSGSVGGLLDIAPNREMQNYNLGGENDFIFGADEGLGDTTVFYTSADNTRAGGADASQNNIVRAGYAAALNANGTFVAGSPFVWSTHRGAHHDNFLAGNNNSFGAEDVKKDPLVAPGSANGGDNNHDLSSSDENAQTAGSEAWYFDACINRTGEYIAVAYLQDEGTSLGFHRALKVVTYQPFRTVAGATGGQAGTQVNLNLRFTAPVEVSQTGSSVSITQDSAAFSGNTAGAETQNRYDALPVNGFEWQDKVGYRCGFQSNNRIIHVLWEQSDGTEDRLFSRRMTFAPAASGTPTAATLGTIVEYETGNLVAANRNSNDNFSFTKRTTFTFLDGTFTGSSDSNVFATDLGATDSQGTNAGSLLVVFNKITDGTTSDGDRGHAESFLVTVVNDAITGRLSLGRNINEDQNVFANSTGFVGLGNSANSYSQFTGAASGGSYDQKVLGLVCVPANATATQADHQPDAVYIYMTAAASPSTNGSAFKGLYTRKLNLQRARNTSGVAIFDTVVPSAGTTGPGSTGYLEPTRLDHNLHADVSDVRWGQNGTAVGVLWMQDNHVWGQTSSDGESYLTQNGAPNPALADQDSNADVISYNLRTCEDSTGNIRDGILGFHKYDFNGQSGSMPTQNADLRLYFRASLRI